MQASASPLDSNRRASTQKIHPITFPGNLDATSAPVTPKTRPRTATVRKTPRSGASERARAPSDDVSGQPRRDERPGNPKDQAENGDGEEDDEVGPARVRKAER